MRLTAARLRKILHYSKSTGLFRWRVRPSNRVHIGDVAGTMSHGYVSIRIDGVAHHAHRLAHLYVIGRWPKFEIDHKNRKRSNNRWRNIREATHAQNGHNKSAQSNNVSGFKGVWRRSNCIARWSSMIKVRGKNIHLGMFGTPEAAHRAYVRAAKKHFKHFARAA